VANQEEFSQPDATSETTDAEGAGTRDKTGNGTKLAGRTCVDSEIASDLWQQRRENEDRGLTGEQAQEKRGRYRHSVPGRTNCKDAHVARLRHASRWRIGATTHLDCHGGQAVDGLHADA
jgi:hypothetical protein